MRKNLLVLLTLVPLVIGYMTFVLIVKFSMIRVAHYLLPFLATAFWFYLGVQYSRCDWKPIKSVLIAHAVHICLAIIYFWQFVLVPDEARNYILTLVSQLSLMSTPTLLFIEIVKLFESDPSVIVSGMATRIALQVLALIYMIIIFCLGLYLGKRISKEYDF